MGVVVWFMVGALLSAVAGAVGGLLHPWAGWVAAVAAGCLCSAMSSRVAAAAGAAAVSGVLGAWLAPSAFWGGTAGLGGTAVVCAGIVARRVGETRFLVERPASRRGRTSRRQDTPEDQLPSGTSALRPREIETVMRLADTDPRVFQDALRSLTPEQREQVRRALASRRATNQRAD
ncbi:hypothetical protein FJZ36_00335 [Candidatus Poribacteria bacterium]|nr:hypothetical protein [Candidatus Poribacteria bacterium]